MTDDELSRVFDMEQLQPYLKGPARGLQEKSPKPLPRKRRTKSDG